MPACLPACLSAYLSICLSVCLPVSLFVCLSIWCLSACLSVCLYASLFYTLHASLVHSLFLPKLFRQRRRPAHPSAKVSYSSTKNRLGNALAYFEKHTWRLKSFTALFPGLSTMKQGKNLFVQLKWRIHERFRSAQHCCFARQMFEKIGKFLLKLCCWTIWVNQRLYFLLSATDFPLLAWYQQAGRWRKAAESGKYVDISGMWSRYFTLTQFGVCVWRSLVVLSRTNFRERLSLKPFNDVVNSLTY